MTKFFDELRFLPKWFRKFETQVWFFIKMHEEGERTIKKRAEEGNEAYIAKQLFYNSHHLSPAQGMEYVIDDFLWYMAKCGYTLQKDHRLYNPTDPNFKDIEKELVEFRKKNECRILTFEFEKAKKDETKT